MIVDGEPINIMVVEKYLADAGFRNLAATDEPEQIIPTLNSENPNVLLLDIMMPGVNGLEILQMIRSSPAAPWFPSSFLRRLTIAR